jgi:hypothetical protein
VGLIWTAWRQSPHAATYALNKGPNTYCARCHSPRNWDPRATVDPPPDCVSCKFDFEAQPRLAQGNPLVAAGDWASIGCDVCHLTVDGQTTADLAWLNTATGQYEPVADATALCGHCHADTEVLRHRRDLGGQAHSAFTCAACHDAHSTQASCTAADCHAGAGLSATPVPGHDDAHVSVACVGCHDAGTLAVAPVEDSGLWITWRTTELLGRSQSEPYQSHNLQRAVDCQRCHYPDNPWQLPLL